MKKVIVTGATGFIGNWVLDELLANKVEVIVIVRRKSKNVKKLQGRVVNVIECNLDEYERLPQLIPDRDIDTIYHFAWQGISDEDIKNEDIQLMNIKATLNLIEVAHKMGISTFVGAGSLHEMESQIEMEQDKVISNLGYMYKSAKIAAHYMGKAKAGDYGIKFFWPIISNTYGEGENSGRLINTVIRKVLKGESPVLSAGKQFYDFVHISDVANAFYLIGEKGIDGTNYMIASGQAKQLREFLSIVGDMVDPSVELGFGKIQSNVVYLPLETFSINKLREDTGFEPKISFEEGIKRTIDWIKEWIK